MTTHQTSNRLQAIRFFIISCLVVAALLPNAAFSACNYGLITASTQQNYWACWGQCVQQWDVPRMDCTVLVHRAYCAQHCANARDDSCASIGGNPVNFSTGEKIHQEYDFKSQGNGFIHIMRRYTSYLGAPETLWGKGWSGWVVLAC